ncbi:hypothetical protein [Methylobacter sp. BBA5.1]|uniref:hypothetical protein n=1 Tax=Methylobacter sp. BBA5.1 TaxID=1495064 RepID=UPI0012689DAD|nr:hypothetical protein [Methylobacter sp. BBA5.1]
MNEIVQLISSIITGIYSGIIVAKYFEFRTLREESSRILHKGLTAKDCGFELSIISSSLKRLGHKNTAKMLSEISNDYMKLSKSIEIIGEDGSISLPSIEEAPRINDENNRLRIRVANLQPSWFHIIFPFL